MAGLSIEGTGVWSRDRSVHAHLVASQSLLEVVDIRASPVYLEVRDIR